MVQMKWTNVRARKIAVKIPVGLARRKKMTFRDFMMARTRRCRPSPSIEKEGEVAAGAYRGRDRSGEHGDRRRELFRFLGEDRADKHVDLQPDQGDHEDDRASQSRV